MSFLIRHTLTDVALDDLIHLIDCHLPHTLYTSTYHFLNKFPEVGTTVLHFYCPECHTALKFENNLYSRCSDCKKVFNKSSLRADGKYFIQIPLREQLKNVLASPLFNKLKRNDNPNPSTISDVNSGTMYRLLQNRGVIADTDITLQWNTDGVQMFNSSTRAIWPIQISINELPYRDRKDNILLCGLWYGNEKPNMNLFLRPFIDELTDLHSLGISFIPPGSEEEITIKVHTLLSPVDSVARAPLQNVNQFNGKFGCSFCLNPGDRVPVGRGYARVYCGGEGSKRTKRFHESDAEKAIARGRPVRGVKGVSLAWFIPLFHIIASFPPEYMHSVLLGVVKTFTAAMLDSHNSAKRWYIGNKNETFDRILENIRPPCEIKRIPRCSKTLKLWKASEWKNFLLYYSLVCFKDLLPPQYFKHWFLLVFSIYTFLQDKISEHEFSAAEAAMNKFVLQVEELYGKEFMKYNTHLLLHIPASVKKFGALWTWSAFPYEHYNGVLKTMFHNSQSVPQQICKSYLRLQCMKRSTVFQSQHCNANAKLLFDKMLEKLRLSQVYQDFGDNLRTFGKPQDIGLSAVQKLLIEELIRKPILADTVVIAYKRFILKNILYHSCDYDRLVQRNNSVVQLTNDSFSEIMNLVILKFVDANESIIIGKRLEISNSEPLCRNDRITSNAISNLLHFSDNLICFRPNNIKRKCVLVPYLENTFHVTPIVNVMETD